MKIYSALINSLAAKPFAILTGNSGTGKTKLAELFAQWLCGDAKQCYSLISVGADWTDNRNVLGFVNHLRLTTPAGETCDVPVYQTTKILDLLLEATATANIGKPFFLILDEMNLSHVERYFADFLSAMESIDGELHLHREGRNLPRKAGGPADVPESLSLPRNLFVIGTVNVDETTYMFSPKVLDRANVLEFRVEGNAATTFLESGGRPIGNIAAAPAGYGEAFLDLSHRARDLNGAAPLKLTAASAELPADAKEKLETCHKSIGDLFSIMQQRHLEFAFRSIAEILRFLAVDYELTTVKEDWDWQAAMDAQILQKILPKLHGSKRKIGPLLATLAAYCEKGDKAESLKHLESDAAADSYAAAGDKVCKDPAFSSSHRKLCEMIQSVRRDQFVSFIQ
jgi:5-methylcytosine-specific restriction endonuclease McrBC GTP-binding regulatory subunit McrB